MNRGLRALNRFGLGARIGEAETLPDPRAWLRDQLGRGPDGVGGAPDLPEIGALLTAFRPAQRARDQDRLAELRRRLRELQMREASALLDVRLRTDAPFVERLVAFWSNHLCVSVPSKRQVSALAGHYERTTIRPHVLGRFEDMLLASAKHPAMLFYLDNFLSVGPGSPVGRRTARRGSARGLNENYARELLELHTLGVDGGYQQEDVEELARILTGWSVSGAGPGSRPGEPIGFAFRPITHEPGAKVVLGQRYADVGAREGEDVIRDLCAHPSTADFVATKLVRHFVADEPPSHAVEAIASTFRDTGGDLRAVAEALVDLEEVWDPRQRKFRTPQDWVVAVLRAFHAEEAPRPLPQMLRQLRHPLWAPAAPKGYGDLEREWADPDSLMNRAELARSLAGAMARAEPSRGQRFEPRALLSVIDTESSDPLVGFLGDSGIPVPERVALAIGGPAFQWR
jgi:uncharacterized protein (DUF1800 family)